MNRARTIHESLMNGSRTIPPRVGVGGGGGLGVGYGDPIQDQSSGLTLGAALWGWFE